MRFLKTFISLLYCGLVFTLHAQDSTTISNDTLAVFQADKAEHGLVLNPPRIPDTTLQRLRSDDAFWYANTDFKKQVEIESRGYSFLHWLYQQTWLFKALWFFIIGSVIAVLLVFLLKSNVQLFHKKTTLLPEPVKATIPDDIFSINYESELQNALSLSDFRFAVRYHYLHVLVLLATKKIIHYKEEATNTDYLQQLQDSGQQAAFIKLTRHFEFAWYGKFALTPATYKLIETDFASFKKDMDI